MRYSFFGVMLFLPHFLQKNTSRQPDPAFRYGLSLLCSLDVSIVVFSQKPR